jgi:ribosomal protein L16 Arg81 hydroxylase
VLWDGMLQDGDMLYIPRGWWHVARPLDEPTLHLTVGVNNLTGSDLLSWFADRMRRVEDVRRDIPHLAGSEATQAFAERLRQALLSEWHPDIVKEFLAEMDAKSTPRPIFALPAAATADVLAGDRWKIRWSGNREIAIVDSGGELVVAASGRRWHFAQAARPLLELLISGRNCSLADLEQVAGDLDADVVRAFARELVTSGLAVLI